MHFNIIGFVLETCRIKKINRSETRKSNHVPNLSEINKICVNLPIITTMLYTFRISHTLPINLQSLRLPFRSFCNNFYSIWELFMVLLLLLVY